MEYTPIKRKNGTVYMLRKPTEASEDALTPMEELVYELLERSDNSDYEASPKLPSLIELNRLLDLKYPTRQDMRKCMWLGKEIIDEMKKLGNFS
jgi:hypothetical protein